MKLYIFVLVDLLALCSAGLYDSNSIAGSNSGYSYGIPQHGSGQHLHHVAPKYTDIIHSAPKTSYGGGSEAVADISTYKIIHENGGGSSGHSYGGFEGSGLSHGYSIPYGTLLADNNEHENYRVIRVIHEYSGRNGHSSNAGGGYHHGGKGKATKTIKVIHDYGSSKGFGAHHSGHNTLGSSNTFKLIHEKRAPSFEDSASSYMPHDHLNEFNGGAISGGGFPNALETVKSLKTIGAFSNLGFSGIGSPAPTSEHLPLVHENYPPVPAPNWKQ